MLCISKTRPICMLLLRTYNPTFCVTWNTKFSITILEFSYFKISSTIQTLEGTIRLPLMIILLRNEDAQLKFVFNLVLWAITYTAANFYRQTISQTSFLWRIYWKSLYIKPDYFSNRAYKRRNLLLLGKEKLAVFHSGFDGVTARLPASWAHCSKNRSKY